ncbi:MAG: NADH-quinone oxidoreductase subunit N [Myxococcaceae bacterium]|nr:NADH-quinone oxidoreductase subunit N [Myxococcaceae bacterium]
MPSFSIQDFMPIFPAAILAVGAMALLLSEAFLVSVPHASASRGYQAVIGVITAAFAGTVAFHNAFEDPRVVLQGFAVLDPFSSFVTVVVAVTVGLAVLLSAGFLKHRNAERGEFYALMLFAAAGMSLLALSAEFITLFVNLEVLSVATYALTAYLRRGTRPAEAGFKYFILGAFSGALLLYGAALLYGATGTTKLAGMAEVLRAASSGDKAWLVYCGMVLVATGFAFKVAAVPFHMWTPDVYEGAPTPVTALMSAGVKAAAFVALIRVFVALAPGLGPQVPFVLFGGLALLTMVAGNLMALPQRNVKRMLAYSSVAHAGYVLLGVTALFAPAAGTEGHGMGVLSASPLLGQVPASAHADIYKAILFYLLGYAVTTIGSFGVLAALERREDETRGTTWDLDRFAGLAHSKPGWAIAMAACMLSLGGIPPTVGFMGKLLVFRAAVDAGLLGLAIVGVLTSAAAAYYYLRVVVYMFMRNAAEGAAVPERHWQTDVALAVATAGVILLGILPGPVTAWLTQATMLALR